MDKSPFYVVPEFISPLMCERLIDDVDFNVPEENKDGFYVKTTKTSELAEQQIYNRLTYLLPELQAYYQFIYKGTDRIKFEWFTENTVGELRAENSQYTRGKWLRTGSQDFTSILFLSEYNDKPPFEDLFEVFGGKLEFPQHQFGFNPQRGTLIVFPSDPHFINITTTIFAGDLIQARINITAQTPYIYQPQLFPGNYTTWFKDQLSPNS